MLAVKLIAAAVILACLPALAQEHRQLTVQESHELVMAAIPESAKQLPKFGLDDFTVPEQPRFFFVEALWDNPSGSVVYDHYAVDKVTGDVWSAVICREEKSRRLRTAQRHLRRKIGLSDASYKKAKRHGPLCE